MQVMRDADQIDIRTGTYIAEVHETQLVVTRLTSTNLSFQKRTYII